MAHATATTKISFGQEIDSRIQSYSTLATLCFLTWDVLITTDEEVRLMWPTAWTWSKPLYYTTRYYSLLALIIVNSHQMTCLQWLVFEGISSLVLEITVELILIIRLYAMYAGDRSTVYTMVAIFFVAAIIMTLAIGFSIPKIMVSPQCIEASLPEYMIIYAITSILCQAFLFSLAIRKYSQSKSEGYGAIGLLAVLVQDGALAFVFCAAVMLANTVLFTVGPRSLAGMGFPWLLAVLGAIGPRMFLHVRSIYMRALPPSTMSDMHVSHDLYFAVHPDDLVVEGEDCEEDESESSEEEDGYGRRKRESLTPLASKASKSSYGSQSVRRGRSAVSTMVSTRGTLGH